MNERIKELMKQAGLDDEMFPLDDGWENPELIKFAELVIADEREACAQLCDIEADFCGSDGKKDAVSSLCAAAIRARSET